MVGVSKVPEVKRPLALMGVTPSLDSSVCVLVQNYAFSLVNKASLLHDLNSGLFLLGRQRHTCGSGGRGQELPTHIPELPWKGT